MPVQPNRVGDRGEQSSATPAPLWSPRAAGPHHPREADAPAWAPGAALRPCYSAVLKPDPKSFRIRFQNTAEPSRAGTPRCCCRKATAAGRVND